MLNAVPVEGGFARKNGLSYGPSFRQKFHNPLFLLFNYHGNFKSSYVVLCPASAQSTPMEVNLSNLSCVMLHPFSPAKNF